MYKGRKFTIVSPQSVYKLIAGIAKNEQRTVSQMATLLLTEALKHRGYNTDEPDTLEQNSDINSTTTPTDQR